MGFLKKLFTSLHSNPQPKSHDMPPLNAKDAYNKGVDCIHNNDWKTALGYLEKAAELDPQFAPCWYALGLTYGKLPPEGRSEEELRSHMKKMCSSFQNAVDLSDKDGSLKPEHYHRASSTIGAMFRIEKQYDRAIHMFRKALEKIPDDLDLKEAVALCFLEKGDMDEAERAVEDLLRIVPDSDSGRKLWKRIRKESGKSITLDLPEEKRKEIYSKYMSIQDDAFLTGSNLLDEIKKADTLEQIGHSVKATSEKSRVKAEKEIMESYKISAFELHLIIKEGKKKAWPFPSLLQLGAEHPQPQKETFRDSLTCVHCGKRNTVLFWPEKGDYVPFYYQSEERTREQPGEFRLPIECPFCNHTWFVVWDATPDPLAGQFIRHIERMCEAHASKPHAVKALRGIITDKILGEHIKFIGKEIKTAFEHQQKIEHSVTHDEYFSTLTIVPAVEPHAICRYLGGLYFEYMESIMAKSDMNLRNTVHWILAWGQENVAVHMTLLPRKSDIPQIPIILPIDLLTPEEKAQAGLR